MQDCILTVSINIICFRPVPIPVALRQRKAENKVQQRLTVPFKSLKPPFSKNSRLCGSQDVGTHNIAHLYIKCICLHQISCSGAVLLILKFSLLSSCVGFFVVVFFNVHMLGEQCLLAYRLKSHTNILKQQQSM